MIILQFFFEKIWINSKGVMLADINTLDDRFCVPAFKENPDLLNDFGWSQILSLYFLLFTFRH